MSDELLRRYLLDQLSDEERTRIEGRFLADDQEYQQLLIVEDELRLAYAGGSLSPEERQRFEERFLVFDDERDKLAEARSFVSELAAISAGRRAAAGTNRTRWLAVAAAVILAVAGLSWQAIERGKLQSQLAQRDARGQELAQQAESARTRRDALERELQEERKTRAVLEQELARRDQASSIRRLPVAVSLFLTAGTVRSSGETKTVRVAADATEIRLMLSIEGQTRYETYNIQVLNPDGVSVWTGTGAPAGEQVVVVMVPARVLPQNDYEVAIRGVTAGGQTERAGNYYFRVLR